MRPTRLAATAAILLSVAVLTGCGKAGRPISPDPVPHPQDYPKVNSPNKSEPIPAKPNKDGKAIPPEWDQEDMNKAFTKDGAFIDPSAHQRISSGSISTFVEQNISQRTSVSGRASSVSERADQSAVDQPLLEPRP